MIIVVVFKIENLHSLPVGRQVISGLKIRKRRVYEGYFHLSIVNWENNLLTPSILLIHLVEDIFIYVFLYARFVRFVQDSPACFVIRRVTIFSFATLKIRRGIWIEGYP